MALVPQFRPERVVETKGRRRVRGTERRAGETGVGKEAEGKSSTAVESSDLSIRIVSWIFGKYIYKPSRVAFAFGVYCILWGCLKTNAPYVNQFKKCVPIKYSHCSDVKNS